MRFIVHKILLISVIFIMLNFLKYEAKIYNLRVKKTKESECLNK
jgi:hypothetical protein